MATASHYLKEIRIVGGFLDGLHYKFSDKLNCIIGARGTGKTTVLEFIRYGLNALPMDLKAQKRINSLVESNLKGGRIEITIETAEGVTYIINRNSGEAPMVLNANRTPTGMFFTPNIFPLDIFSQNEVEEIAEQSTYQLALLESFSGQKMHDINCEIKQLKNALEANAASIIPLKEKENDLIEELNLLPGVQKQLQEFAANDNPDDLRLNFAHAQKSIRDMENEFADSIFNIYKKIGTKMRSMTDAVKNELKWCRTEELVDGVNFELITEMLEEVSLNNESLNNALNSWLDDLTISYQNFVALRNKMQLLHQQQELEYREIVEKGKEEQERSAQRRKVADEHTRLLAKKNELGEVRCKINDLMTERTINLNKLSELRDARFQNRSKIAERINTALSPHIRVTLQQFGRIEPYTELLLNNLKGTGMQYRQVALTLSQRIPPQSLSELIQNKDVHGLMEMSGINHNQASIVTTELNKVKFLLALETVDLPDSTKIELNDHGAYKSTETLSTGQKCNAILPILLLDSERPLLIDQPEDNLDNEFVHETIVRSVLRIKDSRQLVFVTHNPNIPVLAEAESIMVMESDGCAGHIRHVGSVDFCKEDIVNILEGGEEAFKKRKARYSY